ncbi:transposase [Streptomyces sp. NPDC090442]|uniref:transposase n=1 Tax=Streptomyces sp. NPDC090442 TaxID=3365962 RepID=UPI00380E1691
MTQAGMSNPFDHVSFDNPHDQGTSCPPTCQRRPTLRLCRGPGSHPGRFRSEAAFASFAGVAPIPASSSLTNEHRLNRGGDRQLNRAMHTITLIRMRLDPATKAYVARRTGEGKSPRDAQRCPKRNICRQIFKILERRNQPDAEDLAQAA